MLAASKQGPRTVAAVLAKCTQSFGTALGELPACIVTAETLRLLRRSGWRIVQAVAIKGDMSEVRCVQVSMLQNEVQQD